MCFHDKFKAKIFDVKTENFPDLALEIFNFQVEENVVYRQFVDQLGIDPRKISSVNQIPFLPVSFFRYHRVVCGKNNPEIIFKSSGTSGFENSFHYVVKQSLYEESVLKAFQYFYGDPGNYIILALLPNYLEQGQSSLVFMVKTLMNFSGKGSRFYKYDFEQLYHDIQKLQKERLKIFLIGVAYALLDFSESYRPDLSEAIVMETGGMKGRRDELIREELHEILCERLNCRTIHSEYGMTELLSQAYSKADGVFFTPPWMKILIRDSYDPFNVTLTGVSGNINIVDLANLYSCSFLAVDDTGILYPNGSFKVLGRSDFFPLRGCSLMYQ